MCGHHIVLQAVELKDKDVIILFTFHMQLNGLLICCTVLRIYALSNCNVLILYCSASMAADHNKCTAKCYL